jgi:hypothetical protein
MLDLKEGFQNASSAAGKTETTQENIQDWLELAEGDPGFQFLTEEEITAVILFIDFHHHYLYYYIFHLLSDFYVFLGYLMLH